MKSHKGAVQLLHVQQTELYSAQGLRLTFLQTSPVASDNFDFTSQNQFSTSQNFQ